MKRLDRALFIEALGGAAVFLLALGGLVLVVDLFEHVEDFLGRPDGARAAAMYVLLTAPQSLSDVAPFALLLGPLAALGRWARTGELAAAQAAGISARRLSAALGATGILGAALLAAAAEWVLPPATRALEGRYERLIGSEWGDNFYAPGLVRDRRGSGEILHCRRIRFGSPDELERPTVVDPDTGWFASAARAVWEGGPDAGWRLFDGWVRGGEDAAASPIPPEGTLWRTRMDRARILERPMPERGMTMSELRLHAGSGTPAGTLAVAARWAGAWWIPGLLAAALPALPGAVAAGARRVWLAVFLWGGGAAASLKAVEVLAHGLGRQGGIPPWAAAAVPLAAASILGAVRWLRWDD